MAKTPVISFATSKGGSGKSTALIILASVFAHEGGKVAVIDTDPNETVWRWSQKPGLPNNVTPFKARNDDELMDAIDAARASGHQLILVDVEGRASALGNLAISAAMLTVIPVRPSEPDGVKHRKRSRRSARSNDLPALKSATASLSTDSTARSGPAPSTMSRPRSSKQKSRWRPILSIAKFIVECSWKGERSTAWPI